MNDRAMIHHHLHHNHFPPVRADDDMIDLVQAVIDAGSDGDFDDLFDIPDGPEGVPCRELLDALHLWDFLQPSDGEIEDFFYDAAAYDQADMEYERRKCGDV